MIDRRSFLGAAASAAGLVLVPGAARGDGRTDDAAAIQRAVDACAAAGGGEVALPPGRVYLSGTISLRSHVTLRIEHGWPEGVLDDVVFNNVQVTLRRTSQYACGQYDLRPNDEYQQLYRHRIAGVYAKWASNLALRDVSVRWADGLPDCYGPALEAEGVRGLVLRDFAGGGAHADDPARVVDGVRQA